MFFHTVCLAENEYVLDAFILSPSQKPQAGQVKSLWSCSCPAPAALTSLRLSGHLLSSVASPGSCACFLHTLSLSTSSSHGQYHCSGQKTSKHCAPCDTS